MLPSIGQVLKNRLELRKRLGAGGMGMVFAAHDRRLDRLVAVKFVRPEYLLEPGAADAFLCEAQTVAQLRHPHILTVFDLDEEVIDGENVPYIVMEYAAGGTLAQRLAAGPLNSTDVRRIFGQIGAALTHAHVHGIIHLDLKPANILFDDDGQVRVGDFGLARLLQGMSKVKAVTGVGTGPYMPPEQTVGGDVGYFSDIYALGMMLYEVLVGALPRRTWEKSGLVVHLDQPLPSGIAEIVRRATAHDAASRFATMSTMLEAWDALGATEPVGTPILSSASPSEQERLERGAARGGPYRPLDPINRLIQERLKQMGKTTAPVTEVTRWLDQAGVLRDNPANRGKPLRDLLRAGRIVGHRQDAHGHWFIDRLVND